MAYPQPIGSEDVASTEEYWRLNTLLASPGDIYELDVSSKLLCVGPDSDISQVGVTYYDPQVETNFLSQFALTPDRSFPGLIAARPDVPYPTSGGKKGRILLASDDLWDPTFVPAGVAGDIRIQRYVPRMDVIAYFTTPPSVVPQRSDKLWQWDYVQGPLVAMGNSYILLPYYGRKYASCHFTNWMVGVNITVTIDGVRFTNNSATQPMQKQLMAPTAVNAAGNNLTKVIKASVDGMFDALLLTYAPSAGSTLGPIPTRIQTSDDPL